MLPPIQNLILEGPGQRQTYKSHPSAFPKIQNVGFACGFWVSFSYRLG